MYIKSDQVQNKLIKEAHRPQLANTTKERQALQGQHMKTADGKTKTTTPGGELEERWVQHFAALFNQPGEVDANIDAYLPAQRESNTGIKVGLFDLTELKRALKDMDNDKVA